MAIFSFFYSTNMNEKRSYRIASGILMFCAGFSQEQIAFLVIIYSLCKVVESFIKDKKNMYIYLCGIIGSIVLLAAPGNWVRAGENSEFYDLSIVEKMATNIPQILSMNFNYRAVARIYILRCFVCWGKSFSKNG